MPHVHSFVEDANFVTPSVCAQGIIHLLSPEVVSQYTLLFATLQLSLPHEHVSVRGVVGPEPAAHWANVHLFAASESALLNEETLEEKDRKKEGEKLESYIRQRESYYEKSRHGTYQYLCVTPPEVIPSWNEHRVDPH